MKKILSIALIASLFSATAIAKDEVVAVVNGKKITKSEFKKAYEQNRLYVSDKFVTKDKVILDMVNRILGIEKAKKEKLDRDKVVKGKMEDVLYHAQISKDLAPILQKIVVTDEEVKSFYKKYPEYRTAHILLRLPANNPSAQMKAEVVEKAQRIFAEVKAKPDSFAELAAKFSQASNAQQGGDLGFQPMIQLAPEYYKAVNKVKSIGEIVPPVETQFGIHIVKIMAKRNFSDINVNLYKKIIYDEKRDQVMDKYFQKLRSKAKVKINKDKLYNK